MWESPEAARLTYSVIHSLFTNSGLSPSLGSALGQAQSLADPTTRELRGHGQAAFPLQISVFSPLEWIVLATSPEEYFVVLRTHSSLGAA